MAESAGKDFRSLLLAIDHELGTEDVEALKFFCRDILYVKKLQDVTSAGKIFQMLIDEDQLNKDKPFLLAELLYRISQFSLLQKVGYTKKAVEADLPTKGTISSYRQLLYDISEDIGSEDHKEIIFLLNDVVPKKRRENVSTLHLLTHLETQGLISQNNLDTLEDICGNISAELVKKIKTYKTENVAYPCQETAPSSTASRSREESGKEPHSKCLPVSELMVGQTGDFNANYSTLVSYDKDGNVSSSFSRLSLEQASDGSRTDGRTDGGTDGRTDGSAQEFPVYKMGEKCRGYCVIINNHQFTKNMERRGTVKDADALQKVFTWLGLTVSVYMDQKSSDIEQCLQDFRLKSHVGMDCFVCCILSHGESGSVHGSDDKLVPISKLTSYFTAQKCPSLAEKPKIFFIQACQGNKTQPAVLIEEDAVVPEPREVSPKSIPDAADFLLGMATVDGFLSFRNVVDGTWYIQSLCKNLVNLVPRREDILSILIKVNEDVSRQADCTGKRKQMPQPAYTLRKKVIFPVPSDPAPDL